ncbi:MAG: hypothetical protein J6C85_06165 [Alphaproteobacteria bacterium]|nr:hypothetical protein [Alphaproteobacteria bacterium]
MLKSNENKPLSSVLLSSLHQSAKISSTHYSTKIEGNIAKKKNAVML